jgi:hypothetical protein
LGVRRSPDGGLSAEPGDLSAARGACGGVPLAGLAAPGLLGLPPLGVGGVVLPLLLSAAADLRCKNQFFCSDQESNHTTYQDLQPKKKLPHRAGVIDAYFGLAPSIATAAAGGLCSSEPGRWVASAQGRDWEGRSSRCVGVGRCEQQQSTAQPWWSLGGEGRNRI